MIARKYGGSGLGMAIADNIVRLMGGQIVIDSEVGKGSDFIVFLSLPVAKEEEKTGENRQQKKAEIRTGTGEELLRYVRGAHVLLAEDNDINARIILAILEKAGAKIDRAVTGRQAVEMFACSEEGGVRCDPHGYTDAGDGWLGGHAEDPEYGAGGCRPAAGVCPVSQLLCGGQTAFPGGGDERTYRKADRF